MKCGNQFFPHTQALAHSQMAQGGAEAAPVFTEARIEALRNHLRALMKALKTGYSEAAAVGATRKQREDADLLLATFTRALGDAENEYQSGRGASPIWTLA